MDILTGCSRDWNGRIRCFKRSWDPARSRHHPDQRGFRAWDEPQEPDAYADSAISDPLSTQLIAEQSDPRH